MAGGGADEGRRIADAKKAILKAESKEKAAPAQDTAKADDAGPAGKAEKRDIVDFVASPYRLWWSYIQTGYRSLYLKLLKVNFTAVFAFWLILLLVFGLPLGIYLAANAGAQSGILADTGILVLLGALLLAAFLIASWIRSAIVLTAISLAAAELEKKPFSMGETFNRLKWPALRFVVLDFVVSFLLALPLIVLMLVFFGGAVAAASAKGSGAAAAGLFALLFGFIFAVLIAAMYIVIVFRIWGFIAQFWTFGIVIESRGVVESLKRSYALVKANFWETVLFDIATWIGAIVLSIPSGIIGFMFSFAQRLIPIFFPASTAGYWEAYIGILAVSTLVNVFFITIIQLFTLPSTYLYWKQLSGRK